MTAVAFESKSPHTTPWLVLEYDVGQEPRELLEALAAIGWAPDGLAQAPPLPDGTYENHLRGPVGSSLFGGWTDAERSRNLYVCRATLRRFGFRRVPWHHLAHRDLL